MGASPDETVDWARLQQVAPQATPRALRPPAIFGDQSEAILIDPHHSNTTSPNPRAEAVAAPPVRGQRDGIAVANEGHKRAAKGCKVLLVHNFYQQAGGEDRVFSDEAELLRSHGHEVSLLTADNSEIESAVTVRDRMKLASGTTWSPTSYARIAERVKRDRPAVVHFENTFPLISPAAYYAARRGGAAVVQTLQNYRLICAAATLFRDGKPCEECVGRLLPMPAVRHACYRDSRSATLAVASMLTAHRLARTYHRAVDAYIALTEFARAKFVEGGLPADRILVKPNFVSPAPEPGTGDGGYALFCGRLVREKGLLIMLSAWELLGEAAPPLLIAGDGPLRDEVSRRAAALPKVRILGQVEHTTVTRLMGSAAFLVFPSLWYEGFGKVIIEAFAGATPVVAAGHGVMTSLVEHGRNGLLYPPDDIPGLAEHVRWLTADPARAAAMRPVARQTFEQRFTAGENYHQLVAVYQAALDRRHNAAPRP
jgi:glycosyltransferase involved in cell wall biosynthesis